MTTPELPTRRTIFAAVLVGWLVLAMFALIGTANAQTTECVPIAAQHYSYVGGPIEGTPLPPPAEGWQANTTQEPHYQGNATPAQQPGGDPYTDGEAGLHYTSHGSSGLADWFYFQPEVTCPPPPPPPPPTSPPPPPPPTETPTPPPPTHTPPGPEGPEGPTWTPTWEPTWEPTWTPEPKPEYPPLAHTGGELTFGGIALLLAALGSGALWYARKMGKE